jgi:hypothetical protein
LEKPKQLRQTNRFTPTINQTRDELNTYTNIMQSKQQVSFRKTRLNEEVDWEEVVRRDN